VPQGKDAVSIIIGQEFLDCMPVRQFVRTDKGWCEKMVDLAEADSPDHFRFVLSKGPTPAAKICLRKELIPDLPDKPKEWEGIEVSPEAWLVAQEIAKRVYATKGAALLIDYGNDGHASDTLQASSRRPCRAVASLLAPLSLAHAFYLSPVCTSCLTVHGRANCRRRAMVSNDQKHIRNTRAGTKGPQARSCPVKTRPV
jgi:hypothetical protein